MKSIVFIAVLLLVSTHAFTTFEFQDGHKFLDFLKDNDHRCFVILFKNSNAGGKVAQTELNDRNSKQQKALEDKLSGETDITYAVIDVGSKNLNDDTKADIEEFMREAKIDIKELGSYPISVVMDDSQGAYVWGPKHELVINRVIAAIRRGRPGVPHK